MKDETEARLWADHHEDIANGIDLLFAQIMQAFRVLHRIEWSAPWKAEAGYE